jgi:hypothetical protein
MKSVIWKKIVKKAGLEENKTTTRVIAQHTHRNRPSHHIRTQQNKCLQ